MAAVGAGVDVSVLADAVVVGVSTGCPEVDPGRFDVLLTSDPDPAPPWVGASPDDLAARVEASPMASTALVQVLRATEGLAVPEALTVESMAYSMLQQGHEFTSWRAGRPRRAVTEPDLEPVALTRTGGRLDVVLHRPHVRNAFNAPMRDALIDAFELVDLDGAIDDVHLSGAGSNFCSGGDLEEFGTAGDPARAHLLRVARSVGLRVHRHAGMVTAHLHGACVGAGVEIPCFAGTTLADAAATFRLPEVSMGLIPGAGGTVSVPRRVGRHRAAWLALSGAVLDARTAQRWGLVDAVVDAPA
jgi:enoyl-CoA hydratase/carnithine racemase